MNIAKTIAVAICLLAGSLFAQTNAPAPSSPVSYGSIAELNQLIGTLQNASQETQQDLSHMRVDKWKTDSNTKKQTQSDVESLQRNLQNALPTILADLKNSPENLALTFKTYRNLDALYDVMNSVVESAGAFGSKEDFQALNKDLGDIETSRRAFADRMDKLSNTKENEIGQLRTALQQARAEAAPPKKTVVDDTEPDQKPKKPAPKKKPVPKPKTTPAQQPSSSAPSGH